MFERVDWTHGAEHMWANHGITTEVADDALADPNRVVIEPDYNSMSGRSVRTIGFSRVANEVITVIVVADEGLEYGVNGWVSSSKDRRIYNDGTYEAEANEAEQDGAEGEADAE